MQARVFVFFVLVLFITVLAYFPSLDAPFYLDDYDSIVNSPTINSLDWSVISSNYPMRQLGYYTFSLNHAFGGFDVAGFHWVNIFLHLIVACLVGLLTKLLCKRIHSREDRSTLVATTAFVLFALLPLNSQAVIYIVQRLAVMSALFYLLGLAAYLVIRTTEHSMVRVGAVVVLFGAFIAGLMTKQNIATLPLSIFVIEYFLISKSQSAYLMRSVFVGVCVLLGAHLFDFAFNSGEVFKQIDQFSTLSTLFTRWEYFTHQISAIWIYVFKAIVPFPLLLDYSPVAHTWSDGVTWLALVAHFIVVLFAVRIRHTNPLVSTLVFLYYSAHLVESSILPLDDLMFEHRAYLPNVFLTILFSLVTARLIINRRTLVSGFAVITIVCFLFTYQRAQQWRDPMSFFKHELTYVSDNSRSYAAVGLLFAEQGKEAQADKWLRMAIQVGSQTGHLQMNTIIQYVRQLLDRGEIARANRYATMGLKVATRNQDRADVFAILALVKAQQGLCKFADGMAKKAAKLAPTKYSGYRTDCDTKKAITKEVGA